MADPGLPRQVVRLAANQTRQDTECGSKASALAKSWCLTTCLTPTTAIQEGHRRKTLAFGNRCTSRPTGGLPPLPCWSKAVTRGLYPGRDPPLPAGATQRYR